MNILLAILLTVNSADASPVLIRPLPMPSPPVTQIPKPTGTVKGPWVVISGGNPGSGCEGAHCQPGCVGAHCQPKGCPGNLALCNNLWVETQLVDCDAPNAPRYHPQCSPRLDQPPRLESWNEGPPCGVEWAQQQLHRMGYLSARVDGVYGPQTREALVRFQADRDLAADGRLGPLTCAALADDRS